MGPAAPPNISASPAAGGAPSVKRRLACFLYEGVLLFGVVMLAGLLYGVITQQRHALMGSTGLQAFLFMVLGGYFVMFWCKRGQTLAMLTWHIRVVTAQGDTLSPLRAACRYVLCWLWFLPALAIVHFMGLKGGWPITGVLLVGVLAYAALARLHPQRQYLHDAICGTRLVHAPPPQRKKNT
jgi:uncharacterized RDD family membrane protein YckC